MASSVETGLTCTYARVVYTALQARFTASDAHFVRCYPRLALTPLEFNEMFEPYAHFAPLLMDTSAAMLERSWMAACLAELNTAPHAPRMRRLVCALFLAAAVVPVTLAEQPSSAYSPYALDAWLHCTLQRVLTPALLRGAYAALVCGGVAARLFFYDVLPATLLHDDTALVDLGLPRLLLLLNLLVCDAPLRARVRNSQLFTALLASPHVSAWLRARWSGSVEQRYLNSCEVAAQLSALALWHATPASLLVLARLLLDTARTRFAALAPTARTRPAYRALWSATAPSVHAFVRAELVACTRECTRLEHEALVLACAPAAPATSAVLALHDGIHALVQRLAAVWRPESPRYLTPSPLSSRWHASALLMTLVAVVVQLLPWQPHMLARLLASSHLGHTPLIAAHAQHWYLAPAIARALVTRLHATDRAVVASAVRELWWTLFDMGGTHFVTTERVWGFWSVGHVSLLLALVVPPPYLTPSHAAPDASPLREVDPLHALTLRFLVCDPEARCARLLCPAQLVALVRSRALQFCFEDATFGGTVPLTHPE